MIIFGRSKINQITNAIKTVCCANAYACFHINFIMMCFWFFLRCIFVLVFFFSKYMYKHTVKSADNIQWLWCTYFDVHSGARTLTSCHWSKWGRCSLNAAYNNSIYRWLYQICKFIYSCQSDRIYQFRIKFDLVCATSITFASTIRFCCFRAYILQPMQTVARHDDELECWKERSKKSVVFFGSFAYYVNFMVEKY